MRSLYIRSLLTKTKLAFVTGLVVAVFGLLATGSVATPKASAADCDNNAIIYCGFSTPANFIGKVRANDSGNGHHDLQAIYAAYGLEPASYDRFAAYARSGTSYKDGRIVVDGQVVATGARSIGRLASYQGSGYFSQNIAGTTYYGNTNAQAFASSSIPVTVLFNAQGVMQFAVLDSCGNPTTGNKVVPSYSCTSLHKAAVPGKANSYSFTTSATQSGNAAITKYVYTFGDGTTATTTNGATPVTHTYATPGTYTTKVTLYVHLPGNQNVTASSGGCQATITVAPPPPPPPATPYYQCVQLAGAILDQSTSSYSFTATASYGNGATLVSADFDFGDGTSQNGVKPTTSTTFTVQHTYAVAGNYNAGATLHFMANGVPVTAPTCKALVTPTTAPTPECKPNVPVGSPECLPPCQPGSSVPPESPQCIVAPPPVLPNTGAGNTIAIFAGVFVGGFLVYRQLLFRKHKAAFLAAEQGTSPLPLAEPLDDEAPLAATPLAPKSKSFRRPRQF